MAVLQVVLDAGLAPDGHLHGQHDHLSVTEAQARPPPDAAQEVLDRVVPECLVDVGAGLVDVRQLFVPADVDENLKAPPRMKLGTGPAFILRLMLMRSMEDFPAQARLAAYRIVCTAP